MNLLIQDAGRYYRELFGEPDFIVRSPGRINLIGEHTDYNGGFVLPAAIDNAVYVSIGKRDDAKIALYSVDFQEHFEIDVTNIQKTNVSWANYVLSVVVTVQKAGYKVGAFNAVVRGDIPIGSGLSSSAAVECAVLFALNELFELGLDKMQMVKLAQQAENEFIGVKCGIMDQFASMFGKQDQVIQLDCRSLEYTYFNFQPKEYQLLLLNTKVKHSLADSEYNLRRLDCEAGVAHLQTIFPEVSSLRDVTEEMVEMHMNGLNQDLVQHCLYAVQEIKRVEAACKDLINEDYDAFGKKMFETHKGLSEMYHVSCPELDFLVHFAANYKDVLGARMMGGGFGGCTINLIRKDKMSDFISSISAAYFDAYGLLPEAYPVTISSGTSRIESHL
jgi:galactokinase